MPAENMNDLVALCKRRGFVFGGSEIYGGLAGLYDYGPNGVELLKNIKNAWWNSMVYQRDDVDGLDAALISSRLLWKYSGHEGCFADPLVICKKCNHRMRQDKMADPTKCESCASTELNDPIDFMQMMGLKIGAVDEVNAYLRPETATTTYTNFKNVLDSTSRKIPFGLVQIGKAFRNEIAPRGFLFRMQEFEQAELQYFVHPNESDKWYEHWKAARMQWWIETLGIPAESLTFLPHDKLSHYARAAWDIGYNFPDGFDEVEGIHHRQDFDLGSHTRAQSEFNISAKVIENKDSLAKLNYADSETKENYIPHVIETAMGVGRAVMAVLHNAYTEEEVGDGTRIVLKLKPTLSPVKAAVIPLARNVPEMLEISKEIADGLRRLNMGRIMIENSGNIGKNYRRHDEIGTPICVTVDHQTLEDNTVTIRDRDTMEQKRVQIADVPELLKCLILNA